VRIGQKLLPVLETRQLIAAMNKLPQSRLVGGFERVHPEFYVPGKNLKVTRYAQKRSVTLK
jgi:hypothetical protein